MSLAKKIYMLMNFASGVYLPEAPPLLGFCLEWFSNFVGSESGQKQSVKLLQNMVSNTTQHLPSPYPLPSTHCLYTRLLSFYFGGGGGRGGGGELESESF